MIQLKIMINSQIRYCYFSNKV